MGFNSGFKGLKASNFIQRYVLLYCRYRVPTERHNKWLRNRNVAIHSTKQVLWFVWGR